MNHRLLLSLLFLLAFGTTTISGQQENQQKIKFAIASFGQDPFDTTPTNPQYEKVDGNGARYAIIKVTSTNPEDDLRAYRFNFGQLNSIVEEHDGQLWVYVQRNAKIVTISREGYQTIDKHDLGLTIEAGKTYIMQLASAGVTISRQTVMFNVSPPDANATIVVKSDKPGAKEEEFGTTNASGMVGKNLELGTYTYRVVANHYQPTEGRITLNDKSNVHIEPVKLQDMLYPQGIMSKPFDSKVYINGQYVGKTAYVGDYCIGNYSVGDYDLELRHRNYYPLKQKIHFGTEFQKDSVPQYFELKKQYLKEYSVYIQGFFGTGMKHNMNLGIGIGTYLKNFNLELDYAKYSCFSSNTASKAHYKETTPDYGILIKLGYGLFIGHHWRITPQLGFFHLKEKDKQHDGYLWSASVGARFEYMPVRHLGLFFSPNAQIRINDHLGYHLERYYSGFDLKFGIFISF